MELRNLYSKDPQAILRQSHIWELLARGCEHHIGLPSNNSKCGPRVAA